MNSDTYTADEIVDQIAKLKGPADMPVRVQRGAMTTLADEIRRLRARLIYRPVINTATSPFDKLMSGQPVERVIEQLYGELAMAEKAAQVANEKQQIAEAENARLRETLDFISKCDQPDDAFAHEALRSVIYSARRALDTDA